MTISSSPERNTFQMEKYIERCKEEGKEPSQAYLDMYLNDQRNSMSKFDKPESRIDSLEYDLRTTEWILEKARNNKTYAQNLYAAMCNNEFVKNDVWPILSDKRWSCSWRYAGGIIADMIEKGDYIDWYCSGIRGGYDMGGGPPEQDDGFVGEGVVTEEICQDLLKLGWIVVQDDN
jgi:hypothetical protein